jgi:hypothetical protein
MSRVVRCVVALAASCVVSAAFTAIPAGAESVLTDSARSVVAGQVARSQADQPSPAAARDARVRSRAAFRGLSPTEARQTLLARHPSIASQPGWLAFPSLSPVAVGKPVGPDMLRVEGGDEPDSIVITSQPVAFRDRAGDLRKIDLGLERDGDELVTRESPFGLELPDSLDHGISVGSGDRRFSISPMVSNTADAAIEQYAAFYGDVDPDTDFVAKPVVGGVETFSILRSPASPEQLRFRVSAGAGSVLRPADLAGGFVLSQGDEDLALVSPPQAWDAQHRPVAVEASVDGEDLVLQVAHRDRDVAYPIVVDPTVVDTCWNWVNAGFGCQVDAWEVDPNATYSGGTAGWAYEGPAAYAPYAGPGYLGSGLYIRNLIQNYFILNQAGDWFYRAPPGVRIVEATFSNVSQDNTTDNTTCLFLGVLENTGSWGRASPRTFCGQQTLDTWWTWCPGTSCADVSGGTPGNAAVFGAMAQRTGWSSYWMDHLGASALVMTEMNWGSLYPYISSPDFPDAWQTDPNRWITFHVGDAGLGIKRIDFSSPENPGWQPIDDYTGGSASKSYACTGGTRLSCPMDAWIHMKLGNLREGYSTIRVRVTDLVNKSYIYEHPIGIQGGGGNDGFPPNLNLSGPAVDNAGRLDTGAWDLEATASDGAGIATITTVVDGATDDTQTFNSCAGCGASAEFTVDTEDLGPGGHSIRVIATDRRGNQVTRTLSVSVSRTASMNSLSATDAATSADYSEPPACAGAPPFTSYYAGAAIAGFRLTYSVSSCEPPAEVDDPGFHSVSYGYGTCDSTVDSCGTPVTITSRPLCEAHAKLYRDENGTELPHTSPTLKGVPAASYNNATTTDLYTGTTAISINSASAATTAAVVNAIRRAPASDVPADGLPLLNWPSAAGTTAASILDVPNTNMLNATEVRC